MLGLEKNCFYKKERKCTVEIKEVKKMKTPVPVINDETGETVGEAVPAKMVGAHLKNNYFPYIHFKGKDTVAFLSEEGGKVTIRIQPSKNPFN